MAYPSMLHGFSLGGIKKNPPWHLSIYCLTCKFCTVSVFNKTGNH